MCAQWMQTATVADFESRLSALTLASKWVGASIPVESGVANRLLALRLYYSIYGDVVKRRRAQIRQPLEKELLVIIIVVHYACSVAMQFAFYDATISMQDLVKIMKFNDLNLLTVKSSIQKAHLQLFRLVKRYKVVVVLIIFKANLFVCHYLLPVFLGSGI